MATLAKGTKLILEGVEVTGIIDISWSGSSFDTFETTAHDSATPVRTVMKTLYTNGDITATILWDAGNAQHAAIRALFASLAGGAFELEHVGGAEHVGFDGLVTDFDFDTAVDSPLIANVTITINGEFSDES